MSETYTRREMIKNEVLKVTAAVVTAGMAAYSAHIPAPQKEDLLKRENLKIATENGAIRGATNAIAAVCCIAGFYNAGEVRPAPEQTSRRAFNRMLLKAVAIPIFAGAATPPLMSLTGEIDTHLIRPGDGDTTRGKIIHDVVYPSENIDITPLTNEQG